MVNEPEKRAPQPPRAPTAAEVAAYLRRHPDFLVRHPELLRVLTPPSRRTGDTVVDMQQFMVERQRRELERQKQQYDKLVGITRGNLSSQARVHAAVLRMLAARSLEHLIDILTHEVSHLIAADVVGLCVESDGAVMPRAVRGSLFVLAPGEIDAAIGEGREVALRSGADAGNLSAFGPAAGLVRSEALIRLKISGMTPAGMLAIGSRRTDFFQPHQGTELLAFLGHAVEHCIRTWLDLPRPA
ncbi:MAG: DUF484 family protein [Alphaproteobacteria bacterium]